MHLNRDKTRKIHRNSLRNFPLHGFNEHLHWFRFSGKGKHLNPAARQNPAANPLTTNALQDFQQLCPWYRSQAGLECRGMQTCPGGASAKHEAEQPSHLNRNQTQTNRCNTLRDFPLHGFSKHLHWFRFSGKGKHLNPAARQNTAANPLTTSTLQDFRKLHPRFRSQAGLECRGIQMHPGGTSERLSTKSTTESAASIKLPDT